MDDRDLVVAGVAVWGGLAQFIRLLGTFKCAPVNEYMAVHTGQKSRSTAHLQHWRQMSVSTSSKSMQA